MAHLELDNVSVVFQVREHGRFQLKDYLLGARKPSRARSVVALDRVSLRVADGEKLGILGHNGAGKSTLLRTLAGIYPPTSGVRRCAGAVSSLFDLSVGFELNATGLENIALRGYLQGETPASVRRKLNSIITFSELDDFIEMPVRCYSSGMLLRLAFAIATAIDPEILIVDEVLSAGDLSFQRKARERMQDIIRSARLVVLVSHDLASLESLCDRLIWLDHGRIRQVGACSEVIRAYRANSELRHAA